MYFIVYGVTSCRIYLKFVGLYSREKKHRIIVKEKLPLYLTE